MVEKGLNKASKSRWQEKRKKKEEVKMMIDVAVLTEKFKGCKTLRNQINDLENKLRLRNVRLEDNL